MEPSELDALKGRLKSMWMAGDYGHFAKFLEPGAMPFFDALARRGALPREVIHGCGGSTCSEPATAETATAQPA